MWVVCLQQLHELANGGLDAAGAVVKLLAEVVPAKTKYSSSSGSKLSVHKQQHLTLMMSCTASGVIAGVPVRAAGKRDSWQ